MQAKERFLKACRREPVDRPPVWMMRQAGRYLPEYRQVRESKSTLEMMKDPATACEITLQPIDRVDVDAAILYSDILMLPEAMGPKLDFVRDVGPVFEKPVRTPGEVETLKEDAASRCGFVYETIRLIRKRIGEDFPLLGFAGAPFTVGAYMVGGDGSYDGNRIKRLAYEDLQTFRRLMEKLTYATIDYLSRQIEAGVDAVQLFDTWGGTLSTNEYTSLALPYTREIFKAIRKRKVPSIFYIKGGGHLFEKMIEAGPDVVSIDWRLGLADAKRIAGGRVGIQGNLDPAQLYAPVEKIAAAVEKMIGEWGQGAGYIVNLGHGILEDIPVPHAQAFVAAAKKFGPRCV